MPDELLPNLAKFIIFLHQKTRQKTDVWARLSKQSEVESKPGNLSTEALESATQALLDDYTNDKELTALLSLDGEEFYASR